MKTLYLSIIMIVVLLSPSFAQKGKDSWAKEQLEKMTLEEKIAQLIMVRVHSESNKATHDLKVAEMEKYQFGGVCFYQGTPIQQVEVTNRLQAVSKVPLLIGIDAEWGVAMRLSHSAMFPRQLALGAMDSSGNALIYEMGKEIALQCKALGVHINFAPVVDVNSNSKNPVIGSRSFGEDARMVTEKSICYIKGLQDNGVSACIKHFPGHGDTDVDSHSNLTVIKKSRQELDSIELYPFRKIIEIGVDMVMPGHLRVPALDSNKNAIASLSQKITTDLLVKEMHYEGIIVSDGLDMSVIKSYVSLDMPVEVKALLAGNDILLDPIDAKRAVLAIKKAVEQGIISKKMINEKCLRVLQFKERKGLTQYQPINTNGIYKKLNSPAATQLIEQLTAKTITLLKNEDKTLPIIDEVKDSMVFLAIGSENYAESFEKICRQYGIQYVQAPRSINAKNASILKGQLSRYSKVIIGMLGTNQYTQYNFGIYKESILFINNLSKEKEIIFTLYANPYSLSYFTEVENVQALIVSYQPTIPAVMTTFRAIFGETSFEGRLPVSIPGYSIFSGLSPY